MRHIVQTSMNFSRSLLVAGMAGLMFGVIGVRGAMVATGENSQNLTGPSKYTQTMPRADILDRNGELLATSVAVYSLFADPREIWDGKEVAESLAEVFPDMDAEKLSQRLQNRRRAFVWVKRGLTPRQRQSVLDLGLEGLGFRAESKRIYPKGTLAGHVLGHTGIDGQGQMGVELSYEARLARTQSPVSLTLDSGVQFALEAELAAAAERYQAIGASGIVLEVKSGKLRGLASWPAFNPNRPSMVDPAVRRNRAVNEVYELGSVLKPIAIAAALEAGAVKDTESFNVMEPVRMRGHTFRDAHPYAPRLDVGMVLAKSSNVGTVKITQKLGAPGLKAFYDKLGLLGPADIALPANGRPILPPDWTNLATATASLGHGIAISPLMLTEAYGAIANQGLKAPLSIVEEETSRAPERVMRKDVAQSLVTMLRSTVLNGTGRRADVPGYRIAGKTGTAEKPIPGGYAKDRNITSFASLFPANDPEYVILITLDEPKASEAFPGVTAAWNAAPTTARVVERIAPLLGVSPQFDQVALERMYRQRSAR